MIQTHGRDASWRVHEIEINGVPQLGDVDLPGYLFSSGAMQVPKRPGVSPASASVAPPSWSTSISTTYTKATKSP